MLTNTIFGRRIKQPLLFLIPVEFQYLQNFQTPRGEANHHDGLDVFFI